MLRWLLATAHLLAFGIGLGAIWTRARALAGVPDPVSVRRALRADAWWGIAAALWLATGLPRLFAGLEKPTDYYLASPAFWLKMGLFGAILVLELGPIAAFTRWRATLRRRQEPDTALAPRWARISRIQLVLLLFMLATATAVARGLGR